MFGISDEVVCVVMAVIMQVNDRYVAPQLRQHFSRNRTECLLFLGFVSGLLTRHLQFGYLLYKIYELCDDTSADTSDRAWCAAHRHAPLPQTMLEALNDIVINGNPPYAAQIQWLLVQGYTKEAVFVWGVEAYTGLFFWFTAFESLYTRR
ncbi:uncharacterized protein BP01DRAFT_379124 [Aspergillus saccharolyticus JOP 1030-1]|uniref:Uncharacterized protein n=1 Tax=Aspergillus saccharolyticus JOP 1030-1 TaxID=1450539 RepID=A0A318ZMK2_9EURO|nr:hypothetical protein BP01DRAFT_379124 [Aspergillus saccharolyticus JOP 1030-1]PYH48716.1 hypothetical protein BP01DRAFT_379124 [Aspergillus saccharolyticus JOP 1030-1]